MHLLLLLVTIVAAGLAVVAVCRVVRQRNMHLWLSGYVRRAFVRSVVSPGPLLRTATRPANQSPRTFESRRPVHVFLAVCDHYEPERGQPGKAVAIGRVQRWCDDYPRLFSRFQDSRGQVPQHTFFYPQDEYAPEYLDMLAELCGAGFGDVDVHLHHDNDTAEQLRVKLDTFRETLFHRHGMLRRDPISNEIVYGFIHGNWALCNSRPDRQWCGVDNEIEVLRQTGCYADFTMPSAPNDTQTRTINSIYYAWDRPGRSKSHDTGLPARAGQTPPDDALLMIQGPLELDWRARKWGLIPRIENGDLHGARWPNWDRFPLWMKAHVHVAGQPDWVFIKLHTHGCFEANTAVLLGEPMLQLHRSLAELARDNPAFHYYYVSAWEMAQLVHQAERGVTVPQFDGQSAALEELV